MDLHIYRRMVNESISCEEKGGVEGGLNGVRIESAVLLHLLPLTPWVRGEIIGEEEKKREGALCRQKKELELKATIMEKIGTIYSRCVR